MITSNGLKQIVASFLLDRYGEINIKHGSKIGLIACVSQNFIWFSPKISLQNGIYE